MIFSILCTFVNIMQINFFGYYQFNLISFSIDMCLSLPVRGPCTNNTYRWYYNCAVGRCQQFTYGGCNGSQNNFETLHNCIHRCGKSFILQKSFD